jgi:hypothetical protein
MILNAPQPPGALSVVDSSAALAPRFDFSPQTFDQAMRLADMLAASEMVPKQYRGKPGDCFIAMQWGSELGLKALQALQSIAVVAGKAILLAGGCIIEEDDIAVVRANSCARCRITRQGRPPVERTYSMQDAQQAGLLGKEGPWRTNTQRQMAWRAFWFAARDAAADLLRGISGAEEAADIIPPEKFMGAAEEAVPRKPPAETGPPQWPADAFSKWLTGSAQRAIDKGATHEAVLAFAKAKGKVSAEQEDAIRALKAAPAGVSAEEKAAAGGAPREPGSDDEGPTFGDDSMGAGGGK